MPGLRPRTQCTAGHPWEPVVVYKPSLIPLQTGSTWQASPLGGAPEPLMPLIQRVLTLSGKAGRATGAASGWRLSAGAGILASRRHLCCRSRRVARRAGGAGAPGGGRPGGDPSGGPRGARPVAGRSGPRRAGRPRGAAASRRGTQQPPACESWGCRTRSDHLHPPRGARLQGTGAQT